MSRIGKKPISLPTGVDVKVDGQKVLVKGPKGSLTQTLTGAISVEVDADVREVRVKRNSDLRADRAKHGLYRALIANMIEGVIKGYAKSLEIQGVGYRAQLQANRLMLFVGYNNKVPQIYNIPNGVTITCPTPTQINIVGIDKQLVGLVASTIRAIRVPDVYKGKGIRYQGEVVRKLPGKTVTATGATA
ncbi:MAG: 50S ribosomal protein L6 [Planctomycetota bacterium]